MSLMMSNFVCLLLTVLTLWEAIAAPVDMGMKGMDLIIVRCANQKHVRICKPKVSFNSTRHECLFRL